MAAAMASPLSNPLTLAAAAGRAGAGAGPGFWEVAAGANRWAAGAAEGRGAGGADEAEVTAAAATGAAVAPVGPPGGSVGNLIVGAAEGFGGRLMRTVSFLGWTLPVSFFGGMAPVGMLGMFSAIKSIFAKIVFRPSVSIPYSCPPGVCQLGHLGMERINASFLFPQKHSARASDR